MLKHSLSTLSLSPDTTIILYFPCGQHTTLDDPLAGPSGLIRILISQLLIGWPKEVPNLEFIEDDQSLWSLIQEGHITALCQLFNQLLERLPQAVVVYCIIDGISEYETRSWGWEADANLVVECLRDTVLQLQDPMHRCCTFKALLTCAHKSSSVYKIIPARSRVELRAGNNHPHSMLDKSLEEDIANTLRQWDTSDTLYVEEWIIYHTKHFLMESVHCFYNEYSVIGYPVCKFFSYLENTTRKVRWRGFAKFTVHPYQTVPIYPIRSQYRSILPHKFPV